MGKFNSTQIYALIVGVVVIGVVVFLISNGTFELGGSDDESNDALAQTTAQAEAEAEDQAEAAAAADDQSDEDGEAAPPAAGLQPMDSAFQFGDLRTIVTDVRLTDLVGEEGDETLALERFARVRLSARNTGLEPFSLEGTLILIDSRERRFTPNGEATENSARIDPDRGSALSLDLQPGITTDLVVVFDVPEEAENFRLRIVGGFVEVELDR
ncbi:MAG: protein of unknown function (DUF4352) [Chloroflexi bacterium]|nr:MAG: protein of unknown function (DUF4352) [Chloroflexota bacterium]